MLPVLSSFCALSFVNHAVHAFREFVVHDEVYIWSTMKKAGADIQGDAFVTPSPQKI